MKDSRISWKDTMVGMAMIFIYISHLGNYNPGLLRDFVKFFSNPIIFMASGFFAFKLNTGGGIAELFKKNIKRLLVPYFLWALINTSYISLLNNWSFHETYAVLKTFAYCDLNKYIFGGMLWILVGLFICRISYFLISKFVTNKLLVLFICFVINAVLLFQYNGIPSSGYLRGFYFLVFYCLGDLLFVSLKEIKERYLTHFGSKSFLIIVMSILYLVLIYFKGTQISDSVSNRVLMLELKWVLIPIGLCIALAFISMVISIPFLTDTGRNSIVFCCMEAISKSVFVIAANILSLTISLNNPVACIIFILVIAYCLNYKFVPFINKSFPFLKGI